MLLLLKRMWEPAKYFAVLSRDSETLVRAFITYVRPLLEYCTPIVSLYSVGMIKRVESVQRVLTKKLPYMNCLTYKKRRHFIWRAYILILLVCM